MNLYKTLHIIAFVMVSHSRYQGMFIMLFPVTLILTRKFKKPQSNANSNVSMLTQCTSCSSIEKKFAKQKTIKSRKLNIPAKANAPVSTTHLHRLKLALQQQRLKCTQLEGELTKMRNAIQNSGVVLHQKFLKMLGLL